MHTDCLLLMVDPSLQLAGPQYEECDEVRAARGPDQECHCAVTTTPTIVTAVPAVTVFSFLQRTGWNSDLRLETTKQCIFQNIYW